MKVPEEVSKLVKDSGNNFHTKVARWLLEKGWHVVVSPYYMDQMQNKAREIDLIAEKRWPIKDFFNNVEGYVAVRLFVECKYVPSHSVFWFADKDNVSAKELVCRYNYSRDNAYTLNHHYIAQGRKVAKLFATSPNKSPENDPFYKALNQVLNAMTSMYNYPVSIPGHEEAGNILEYPVVVCSSFEQIYSVDFNTESQPELIKDNFQLEVRYAYLDSPHSRSKCNSGDLGWCFVA